jgi:hypothetical protein
MKTNVARIVISKGGSPLIRGERGVKIKAAIYHAA